MLLTGEHGREPQKQLQMFLDHLPLPERCWVVEFLVSENVLAAHQHAFFHIANSENSRLQALRTVFPETWKPGISRFSL